MSPGDVLVVPQEPSPSSVPDTGKPAIGLPASSRSSGGSDHLGAGAVFSPPRCWHFVVAKVEPAAPHPLRVAPAGGGTEVRLVVSELVCVCVRERECMLHTLSPSWHACTQ